MSFSDDPYVGAALVAVLIMSLALHELAHALVASWCGDNTARDLGRITLNPLKHMDPFLTVILPVTTFYVLPKLFGTPPLMFGGAKPVPVVPDNLRSPHRDMMWVALAGPATNLALAFGSLMALKAGLTWGGLGPKDFLLGVLQGSVALNILLTIFNMLPVPPLDGSRVVSYILPDPVRRAYSTLRFVGIPLLLMAMFFVDGGQELVRGWMSALYDGVAGVVEWIFDTLRGT